MAQSGFSTVFTSLHIPEDDASSLVPRLQQLTGWCKEEGLTVIADISDTGFEQLGWCTDDVDTVLASGLTGLRVDDGIGMKSVAAMSRYMMIALNASTLSAQNLQELRRAGADFSHIEAWHNYYPRPETGLDTEWFNRKNTWLHSQGLKVMAFIAGDGQRRGPVFAGLPTLEGQRGMLPLWAFVELQQMGVDGVFIGDEMISETSVATIEAYVTQQVLTIHVVGLPTVLAQTQWHNRPDVARDVVRLQEARRRQLVGTEPDMVAHARPVGSLTVDNDGYGRYRGEIQITKHDLPADARVNVIGRVVRDDWVGLSLIGAHQAIQLVQSVAGKHFDR
ncbi:hypothetical protein FD19_GL000762 [Lacticaseibacillus thailandensis DSM 22698 = JCM 13996]|uniref:Outer surface protein n=2 Tax=Lacticaseibacillus thailandensis TaxID=381741 RepID=A0A0R2C675_9LACO|nr:hypothetical protein FD19_GL000762 [Lacticaseibacillus thailandensis DSM 22698 = JCM 13996]